MRSKPGDDAMPSDYYKLLEIPKTATPSDIKKAYRRLALKYHPDKNPDNQEIAEKRFKKIAEAYEVLSDADKKRTYDQFGKQGFFKGDNSQNSSCASSFHKMPNFRNSQHQRFQDPHDIFTQFFGDSDPFANFFHTGFDKRSRSSRPRSAFGLGGGLFDNFSSSDFSSAFEEFDIFFNMTNNRSTRTGSASSCTDSTTSESSGSDPDSTRTGSASSYTDSTTSESSGSEWKADESESGSDPSSDDDIAFTNLHDRLFSDVHAQNIHSNLWNNDGFNFQTTHNSRNADRNRTPSKRENLKSTITSTKYVNGKKIITQRVVENGMETVTVEEDGFVTSHIVTYL